MKSFPLLAIPLGFMCLFCGFRGRSILLNGERAEALERAATIGGGLLFIAIGLGYGFFVFRFFFNK